jgi:glycosyltransferase involved in cell wall biosynthesis
MQDEHVSVVRLRRNFGQTAALVAGFDRARGATIVSLDGDLQNDPEDIAVLLKTLEDGYDVVSGWRVRRQDSFWLRRLPSHIANWLISKTTGVHLHDYGCTLKAYRADVIKEVRLYGEMHRFIPRCQRQRALANCRCGIAPAIWAFKYGFAHGAVFWTLLW